MVSKTVCFCILSQLWKKQDPERPGGIPTSCLSPGIPSTLGHLGLPPSGDLGQDDLMSKSPALQVCWLRLGGTLREKAWVQGTELHPGGPPRGPGYLPIPRTLTICHPVSSQPARCTPPWGRGS